MCEAFADLFMLRQALFTSIAFAYLNYQSGGADWQGTCASGQQQSPVVFSEGDYPGYPSAMNDANERLQDICFLFLKEKQRHWTSVAFAESRDKRAQTNAKSQESETRAKLARLEEDLREVREALLLAEDKSEKKSDGQTPLEPSSPPRRLRKSKTIEELRDEEEKTAQKVAAVKTELVDLSRELSVAPLVSDAVDMKEHDVQPKTLADTEVAASYLSSNIEERASMVRGDFVFDYKPLDKFVIRRGPGVFSLRAEGGSFGSLIDTKSMTSSEAVEIRFHAPSEHAFVKEANRFPLEMQIWHKGDEPLLPFSASPAAIASIKALKAEADRDAAVRGDIGTGKIDINQHDTVTDRAALGKEPTPWRVVSLFFRDSASFTEAVTSETDKRFVLPTERLMDSLASHADRLESDGRVSLSPAVQLDDFLLMLAMADVEFLRYDGSDTQPPCEENVTWFIPKAPLPLTSDVLVKFVALLAESGAAKNARLAQNVRAAGRSDHHSRLETALVRGWTLFELVAANTRDDARSGLMSRLFKWLHLS